MSKKDILSIILAIAGTVLVWFPVLAPILFWLTSSLRTGMFGQIDYLVPAEFFPVALAGGVLLLWAALRVRKYWKFIGLSLAVSVGWLMGGQAIALLTGLASGERELAGILMVIVLGSIAIYTLALVLVGIGGIVLLRDLVKYPQVYSVN